MITMKNIIQDGHPTLRKKAVEVAFPLSKEIETICNEMVEYLVNSQDEELAQKYQLRAGVGLAAPQINHSIRIFAIYLPYEEGESFKHIFINPKIISHTEKQQYLSTGEGCLSVDDEISGFVPRYKSITIEAYNMQGEKFKMRLNNYEAIIFQHEFDHLNGILFTDKVTTDVEHLEKI